VKIVEKTYNLELTKNEYLILLKALITQNAVNGVVDKELADLMGKVSQAVIEQK
jgi:hypothetical protein